MVGKYSNLLKFILLAMIAISSADLSAADSQDCQVNSKQTNTTKSTNVCNAETKLNTEDKKSKKNKTTSKNYFGFFKLLIPDTLR